MLDRRTRESRLVQSTRADLLRHLPNPTIVQRALIDRAAWLTLRVNLFETKLAGSEQMSDHAARQYLAFSNSLARVLRDLGIKAGQAKPRTLDDLLRDPARAAAA